MDMPNITGVLGPLTVPFDEDRFQLTDEEAMEVLAMAPSQYVGEEKQNLREWGI